MPKMDIPPIKVCFPESDRQEILARIDKCLAEGQVAQGPYVEEFEALFRDYVGCKHAIALCNGGCALEAAMRALDVRGKEVLVPANTFLATAAAVIVAGGTVRLVDIDNQTLAPTPEAVRTAISPRTAGLIMVHIGGFMSKDLLEIRSICEQSGIWLFEDCAHAHGSALTDTQGGMATQTSTASRNAGRIGIGGAYSFFSTKIITCGEGGMLVTDDDTLADRARILRSYGKRQPWLTYCEEIGMNWRLNELAAIVGITQVKRLDEFIAWREKIAAIYTERLSKYPDITCIAPAGRCSWYKYIVLLSPGTDREKVRGLARENGLRFSGGVYDLPLHRQPVAKQLGWAFTGFHGTDDFCERHLCLPLYHGMTPDEADYVVDTFIAALEVA